MSLILEMPTLLRVTPVLRETLRTLQELYSQTKDAINCGKFETSVNNDKITC